MRMTRWHMMTRKMTSRMTTTTRLTSPVKSTCQSAPWKCMTCCWAITGHPLPRLAPQQKLPTSEAKQMHVGVLLSLWSMMLVLTTPGALRN